MYIYLRIVYCLLFSLVCITKPYDIYYYICGVYPSRSGKKILQLWAAVVILLTYRCSLWELCVSNAILLYIMYEERWWRRNILIVSVTIAVLDIINII